MFNQIRMDLYAIKQNFGIRVVLYFAFGFVLAAANIVLFAISVQYAVQRYGIINNLAVMFFALVGIAVSLLLITLMTIHTAANRDNQHRKKGGVGSSIFTQARAMKGKDRRKYMAIAIIITVAIWATGIGVTTYYFVDKAHYNDYISVQARVAYTYTDNDGDTTARYEYTVNGTAYTAQGHLQSSGGATPQVGDIVTIKYNPSDPSDVYLSNEKVFLLGFGSFFLYIGLLLLMFEIANKGWISSKIFYAFILIGLTAVVLLIIMAGNVYGSVTEAMGRNLWIFFILLFTNIGIMFLFEGIIDYRPVWSKKQEE